MQYRGAVAASAVGGVDGVEGAPWQGSDGLNWGFRVEGVWRWQLVGFSASLVGFMGCFMLDVVNFMGGAWVGVGGMGMR